LLESYIKQKLQTEPLLLMTHAVVGYPSLDDNWRMLECMQDAGVSLVELQMPFSEPIADGPLFVRANQQALQQGINLEQYFDFMTIAAREFGFPLIYMGYYNSVYCMGHELFCNKLKAAGGQGYIIADLPPEAALPLDTLAGASGLDPIHLMTPTNSNVRLQEIAKNASGFIYCVARKGVTGSKTELGEDVIAYLQRCRETTSLPVALGFGIKSVADITQLKGHADIAIIGTACLEVWENEGAEAYLDYLGSLVAAGSE
jgi:tryptophan synthase alpha chain